MYSYLIVKTGKSGMRIDDLWRMEIAGEKITPIHRLTGSWRNIILNICKARGARGTMSVLAYKDKATVDELIKDYNKSLLGLQNLNWQPVARIDADIEELGDLMTIERNKAWDLLAELGRITVLERDRKGRMQRFQIADFDRDLMRNDHSYRIHYHNEVKAIKKLVNLAAEDVFIPHVMMIENEA